LADVEAAGGENLLVGIARRAVAFRAISLLAAQSDCRRMAFERWPTAGAKTRKQGTGKRLHFDRFPGAMVEKFFCFTAISMKALAARLCDLSLRKTMARSRRIWASQT